MSWFIALIISWFPRWFPLKAETLEEFIDLLIAERCTKVLATCQISSKSAVDTNAVGTLATWKYYTLYTSTTINGRPIRFIERYGKEAERWGSSRGFVDQDERTVLAVRCAFTAYDRIIHLKQVVPSLVTEVWTPAGKLEGEMQKSMREMVEKYNLSPFPTVSPKISISPPLTDDKKFLDYKGEGCQGE